MQIHYSPTSPYARNVRATAIEKGIHALIDWLAVDPFAGDPELDARNPLGKVPVLVLDDGRAIFDSRVICEYLDSIGTGPALLPQDAIARSEAATRQALANGVMDAAFLTVMEQRRPVPQRSTTWLARWEASILRAVSAMERQQRPAGRFDLGDIAAAVALGYLDLRLSTMDWRSRASGLAAWHADVLGRSSLAHTAPAQA